MGAGNYPGEGVDVGEVVTRYGGNGEGHGAGAGDVSVVGALVEENVGCCLGDGDGPVVGDGDGPGVEAQFKEDIG
jgi:hypothetical protein